MDTIKREETKRIGSYGGDRYECVKYLGGKLAFKIAIRVTNAIAGLTWIKLEAI